MIQLLTQAASGEITTPDTLLHAFPSVVARVVIVSAPETNLGTLKITSIYQTSGIDLAPGDKLTLPWLVNLNLLAYQASVSGDKIQYFAGGSGSPLPPSPLPPPPPPPPLSVSGSAFFGNGPIRFWG